MLKIKGLCTHKTLKLSSLLLSHLRLYTYEEGLAYLHALIRFYPLPKGYGVLYVILLTFTFLTANRLKAMASKCRKEQKILPNVQNLGPYLYLQLSCFFHAYDLTRCRVSSIPSNYSARFQKLTEF